MHRHAPDGYVCPFCALAAGTSCKGLHSVPDDIICRDQLSLAFISAHWGERNAGPVLVASVEHFENLYELPDDVGSAVFAMSKRVAIAMRRSYQCDGISIRQHNEPAGSQDVWHYHVHIIPRYASDGLNATAYTRRLTTPPERSPFAARLRTILCPP
jgi:histidine triad (HIT) family protein